MDSKEEKRHAQQRRYIKEYLHKLRRSEKSEKTELTDRSALEELLQAFATEKSSARPYGKFDVHHEPPRDRDFGAPDFKVLRPGSILGYVEAKPIGTNLHRLTRSKQIVKYQNLSQNILLTDYISWLWLGDENKGKTPTVLCTLAEFDDKRFQPSLASLDRTAQQLEKFFSTPPKGIKQASELAEGLATRCKYLKEELRKTLHQQEKSRLKNRLFGLYKAFQKQISEQLQLDEFVDAYAQMIGYGLLLARLQAYKKGSKENELVTLDNAQKFFPKGLELLREQMGFLPDLKQEEYNIANLYVEEILTIVNHMDVSEIHKDLAFRNRKIAYRGLQPRNEKESELFSRDPFVYFYEDFLASYDKGLRKQRGVYYTPPPVVRFIVSTTDYLLRERFKIREGFANSKRVTALDFAAGTGTFLVEIFQQIFDNIGGVDSPKAKLILCEHILKNIHGFEYLLAPYTVAHLKLTHFLENMGHEFRKGERLSVYMTNTLERMKPQGDWILPSMAKEGIKADEIKDKKILVITGNPPYSIESMNKSDEVSATIEAYKYIGYKFLRERNWKALQDDYVKFLRFAQMKMDKVDEGIVAVITNHGYLDNLTFRGMRHSLMQSFQQIYVIDLHGNVKKKEQSPEGGIDQNVFDIQQGVAIAFFIKKAGLEPGIFHTDFWGTRLEKYHRLARENFKNIKWKRLEPVDDSYLFIPQNQKMRKTYKQGWQLSDIFIQKSIGIVTARDKLAVHMEKEELMETVQKFSSLNAEQAREEYCLGKDGQDWKVSLAQEDIKDSGCHEQCAQQILYRPFDRRWTYYTGKSRGFLCRPRHKVMRHMLQDNLGIGLIRKMDIQGEWNHVLACDIPITNHTVSLKEANHFFPLYRYTSEKDEKPPRKLDMFIDNPDQNTERTENFSPSFRKWIDKLYPPPPPPSTHTHHHHTQLSAEDILGYIYAVLHTPSYRQCFAEFLKTDFPYIPFPAKRKHLEDLTTWGNKLINAHLLREAYTKHKSLLQGKGNTIVNNPKHHPSEDKLFINKNLFFTHVTTEIWQFQIGGYKVLEKYIKARKGRILSLEEVQTLEKIIHTIDFSLTASEKIDKLWKKAFPNLAK